MQPATLDLQFSPVVNSPCTLTAEQISHYNRHGYVQPFDILSGAEVAATRQYIDGLMQDAGDKGAYGINCYQARLAGLWDIATNSRILDLVEDIIGPNILCWATAILSKAPHDPKRVPWHQDASFWKLTPARTVTVWLAIDDADESNSAMQFIPGTHNNGALAMRKSDGASVFHIETEGADDLGQPFTNSLKAGQASLHADMLVHGSQPNVSDRRRCGFTLRYCPPEVQIVDAEWARGVEAILCRGNDVSGRWEHHSRPQNDNIARVSSPHVVGNN
jgi:hypothetical protein